MGTGLVICSRCQREIHQDGDRDLRNGWQHCEDGTPICEDSGTRYPSTRSEIRGRYCGADGPAPADDSLTETELRKLAEASGVDYGIDARSGHKVAIVGNRPLAIDHLKGYFRSDRDATRPDTTVPKMHRPLVTGVATTEAAMAGRFKGDNGRLNKAAAFLKRAKKSDVRRKMEKRTRKANRRRR